MDTANVVTTVNDPQLDITLRVFAYRRLSDAEMRQQWLLYRARSRRKLKRGMVLELHTIIGYDGR